MGGVFSGRRYWEISTRKKFFTSEFSRLDALEVHKALYEAGQDCSLFKNQRNALYYVQ